MGRVKTVSNKVDMALNLAMKSKFAWNAWGGAVLALALPPALLFTR